MLKIGKVLLIALSMSVFSSSIHGIGSWQERTREMWNDSTTNKVLMVGVPAAIVAGIVFLYRWITKEESNEKMYIRLNRLYNSVFDTYNDVRFLHNKELINSKTEEELIKFIPLAPILEVKLRDIGSDIHRLKMAKDSLQTRINCDVTCDAHKNTMLSEMNLLLANLKNLIEALEPINAFWQEHKVFFRAYKTSVGDIAVRYQKIIENSNDKEFIKRSIMSHAVNAMTKIEYPYLHFANRLKNDIDDLNQHKQKIARYPFLYERITLLIGELKELLDTVAMMPEYTNDKHLKQQHELEQERIAIARQTAEAERAKAQAMAQQAAAERAKADAMYQQAAAERAKAQAMKEQTLVQLAQPKPQPQQININVQAPAPIPSPAPASQTVAQQAAPINKPSKPSIIPTSVVTPPPSYDVSKFFEAVENLMPSALSRLDFHMPQLEARYGQAGRAIINNHSLISAAIEAKNLTAYNKADLIAWLKNYGIRPTSADEQKARQTGDQTIMKAVLN